MSAPVTNELFIRRKKQRGRRNLFGLADTAQHQFVNHRSEEFGHFQKLSRRPGFDQPRRDGVGADTVFAAFHRELPCHGEHAALGRRMGDSGQHLVSLLGRGGGDVDDGAAAARHQKRPHGFAQPENDHELVRT